MNKQFTYKLRAVSTDDALLIRQLVHPWILSWQEVEVVTNLNETGQCSLLPSIDITFSLRRIAPALPELRWLFSCFVGLNVSKETIEFETNYTGKRNIDYTTLQTHRVMMMSTVLKDLKNPSANWTHYWNISHRLS